MIRTYILVDPTAPVGPPKPFYIGCGKLLRPCDHFERGNAAYYCNDLKRRLIDRLKMKGYKPKHCIRYDKRFTSIKRGLNREAVLIARYGTIKKVNNIDKGILTNAILMDVQREYLMRNGKGSRKAVRTR